jgi:hypothetical protein
MKDADFLAEKADERRNELDEKHFKQKNKVQLCFSTFPSF